MDYYETKTILKPESSRLWRFLTNPWCLAIATLAIIFLMLGAKEMWTQEWRWANITQQMMILRDYLHPYLAQYPYYDKPLLSYWLMILSSFITGGFNIWALRLPDALAGLVAVWSIYSIGKQLANKQTGAIAGWLLISTFYFVFWTRVASADMLNLAGTMLVIAWYFMRRNRTDFLSYFIFFLIIALSALCKGLVALAVVAIVLLPDLLYENKWTKHINFNFLLGLIISVLVYLTPFWLSFYFDSNHYHTNGLIEVYAENFIRYFAPFDHKNSIYTYFIFLPIYTFPWIFFFIPAFINKCWKWRTQTVGAKWMMWATTLVFIFFTLSGSRRSYYTLPIVPFAILVTAHWICEKIEIFNKRKKYAMTTAISCYVIIFLFYVIVIPIAYSGGGLKVFSHLVQQHAIKTKPWKNWSIAMLDAKTKTSFYLNSPNLIQFIDAKDDIKDKPTRQGLLESFPILQNNLSKKILIIRKIYLPFIDKKILKQYDLITEPRTLGDRILNKVDPTAPIALIPKLIKNK